MGFFSAIKKFFGNDDAAQPQTAQTAQTASEHEKAAQPAAAEPAAEAARTIAAPETATPAATEHVDTPETDIAAAKTPEPEDQAETAEAAAPESLEVTAAPETPTLLLSHPADTPEVTAAPDAAASTAKETSTAETTAAPATATAEVPPSTGEAAEAAARDAAPAEAAPAPRADDFDFMAALGSMAASTAPVAQPDAAPQKNTTAETAAEAAHIAAAQAEDLSEKAETAHGETSRVSTGAAAEDAAALAEDTAAAQPAPTQPDAAATLEVTASTAEAATPDMPPAVSHDYAAQSADTPVGAAAPAEQAVTAASPEEAAMTLRLRDAEPRLSAWLGIVLEGVSEADDLLWKRLRFLLRSLDAPDTEVASFIDDFKGWLARMEYRWLEEFRSELQYRLALALELEDEEDERSRLFIKLTQGLARTREHFARRMDAIFSAHSALNDAFWEEMEELFIMADLGYEPALELVNRLKERARKAGVTDPQGVRDLLRTEVEELFRAPRRISAVNPPEVILMIGVNGVGKTTTIAKLAHRARMQGKKVLIAAADTFRAAAVEQLHVWADRVGADFHCKDTGADPAAVAYEAMDRAVQGGYDVLFVDTAGRLQTKVNLMEELTKIRQVLGKKHEGAPHRSILVIDATTGQNALSQTKLFKEAAGVDELILTKLDGTAKGGVAIAVAMQYQVPITFVGLGEKLEDLRPFNGGDFARALLGEKA